MSNFDPALEREMIEWRHDLHRHPEFGFEENRTSDFIACGWRIVTSRAKTDK